MEAKEPALLTIEDIENLPDGERAELFDGVLYMMAPPTMGHQAISAFLFLQLGSYLKKKKGLCQIFAAPCGVYLNQDQYNYVEPDLMIICDPKKIDRKGCHGAPDFIIEIVSPSSRSMDYLKKLIRYEQSGVREYWIVDPYKKNIHVYFFEQGIVESYTFEDKVKVRIYDDCEIDFRELSKQLREDLL